MKEIRSILTSFKRARESGLQCALATVVHVEGSSYRRPGARMLVTEKGELTGAISGGCLEGDGLRKALYVMQQGVPMLVTYDTTDEDDAKLGVGLGCEGVIQVLFEPIDPDKPDNPIALLEKAASLEKTGMLVTLFSLERRRDPQMGTVFLLYSTPEGKPETLSTMRWREQPASPKAQVVQDARSAWEAGASVFHEYQGEQWRYSAFLERVQPPVSLNILGAGNDVMPLAQMASTLGWDITIMDGRSNLVTTERFPQAGCVVYGRPEDLLQRARITEKSVLLLMTHNYNYDLAALKLAVDMPFLYIGCLGPRKKLDRMLREMEQQGQHLSEEQYARIFGPTGLHIGAVTPEEIALSILAEIQSVLTRTPGVPLRDLQQVIHSREETQIREVPL